MHASGPAGRLPLEGDWLRDIASRNVFGWSQDAAIVLRRLIRSLPTWRGVLGIATCDKGLPAL